MKNLFRNIMIALNVIAVLALLITYSSVYISPAKIWFPAFFGLSYPYILLVNAVFVVYWLFRASKVIFLSLAAILLGINHMNNYFRLKTKTSDKEGIVVCSYNVKHFEGSDNTDRSVNISNIKNYLLDKNADIICLQEANSSVLKSFNPFSGPLPASKVYSSYSGRKNGPVIISRYPIIKSGDIIFGNSDNMIVFADMKAEEDTIRVYSCHLQSYRITDDDISRLDSISFRNRGKSLKDFRLFASKLKQAFIKRTDHADTLRSHIAMSPYPVIVCGDFNDTPVSYTYRVVSDNLKDAFVQSGAGTGNSYLGRLPSFRIDYILHSDIFEAYNFTVDKVSYSDHYPISCTLVRRTEKAQDTTSSKSTD